MEIKVNENILGSLLSAIRSGDYYLFEEESESEEEVRGKKVKDSITIGQDDEEDDTPNPLQVKKLKKRVTKMKV